MKIKHGTNLLGTIKDRVAEPLESKIKKADELIREFVQRKSCIAWSGGKSSTVVLHMCLKYQPEIQVIFNNTGVEYPEIIDYINQIRHAWNLNFVDIKPEMTFWQCVDKWGFPEIRGYNRKARSPKCCLHLKEYPAKKHYRKNDIEAVFTGLQAVESRNRQLLFSYRGDHYYSKKWKCWKVHPIGFWTDQNIFDYTSQENFEFSKIYKKIERSGCMPCTGFKNWKEQLAKSNPKMLSRVLMLKEGQTQLRPPCGANMWKNRGGS